MLGARDAGVVAGGGVPVVVGVVGDADNDVAVVVGAIVAAVVGVGEGVAGSVPISARTAKKVTTESNTTTPAIRAIHFHGGSDGSG